MSPSESAGQNGLGVRKDVGLKGREVPQDVSGYDEVDFDGRPVSPQSPHDLVGQVDQVHGDLEDVLPVEAEELDADVPRRVHLLLNGTQSAEEEEEKYKKFFL